ncbi:MAG TPA: MipA/OmpV family protein [Burkholderiales bacterium]|nr:MipA/OmpV family protein [Burkholderiales bacterium]
MLPDAMRSSLAGRYYGTPNARLRLTGMNATRDGLTGTERGSSLTRLARACFALLGLLLSALNAPAQAQTEPLFEAIDLSGRAGLGLAIESTTSPYEGVDQVNDLLPLYLYEGDVFYIHSYRAGFKLPRRGNLKLDLFVKARFEGFPYDQTPASLAGMEQRNPGLDGGIGVHYASPVGDFKAEYRQDISDTSDGAELIAGYGLTSVHGRFLWHPYVRLSFRDSDLNDYYYGVRPDEATAQRSAYEAGGGLNIGFGLYGRYKLSSNWKLVAGVGGEKLSSEIEDSPIVDKSWLVSASAGILYDFQDEPVLWTQRKPVIVRVFYGASTDCILNKIITFQCASISTDDNSRITGVHLGRTFMERVNDWPLDFVGYVGALYRDDGDFQKDSWQVDAYMKPYWYGFPWSNTLRTRIGFGIGLSYASRVPYVEERDQTAKGEPTSKLLNYLDPSIEISISDLFRPERHEPVWLGVGVSHRSGAFGSSQLLGNVDGGSNYLYLSLESSF